MQLWYLIQNKATVYHSVDFTHEYAEQNYHSKNQYKREINLQL
ncbi:hypothetical protein FLAN108750_04970 [Flavobacterium antarcticum]